MASPGRRFLLVAILSVNSLLGSGNTSAEAPELDESSISAFFDAALATQIQEHEIVGAVVSVVQEGEVIFKKGYGWADLESRTPADPDRSLFRIASISKPFVWTAVMQLVEEGRLSLDDDVNSHLKAFKMPETFPEPIRIRHLLTHTPGLEDQAIGMNARSIETKQGLEEYLMGSTPARVRPPGVRASYSNWGTTLAAYIVQIVSGEPWSDYIDRHILEPLAMHSTNTQTKLTEEFAARMATSYTWGNGAFNAIPYAYMNDEPAGALSTTADDMSRFMLAHLNLGSLGGSLGGPRGDSLEASRILSAATARQMQSPLFDPHPGIPPMLHGFYRADRNGQIIFGHGGDTNQFHSQLSLFPAHDLGIFISFNSDPAEAARSNLIPAFVDHFFPTPFLRRAPEPVPAELDDYSGEYIPLRSNQSTLERLGILVSGISIAEQEGELSINGASRWVPLGDDRFTGRYSNRLMVFERTDGEVSHVLIGSPLSTFRKVSGLNAPGNQQLFIGVMIFIAFSAVLGYGYRAFARAPETCRLPRHHVFIAWIHALLVVCLYLYLANTLAGNIEDFAFGVPPDAQVNVILLIINTLLGLVVLAFAARHWLTGTATTSVRIRYSLVGLASLMNLWVTAYFNILNFPFQF